MEKLPLEAFLTSYKNILECFRNIYTRHLQVYDGAQGSKVVVTTRNRDVARMMGVVELHDIEVLSDKDCWSLFAQHAFENRSIDESPNLMSIGKKIVGKYKGRGASLVVDGGVLHSATKREANEGVGGEYFRGHWLRELGNLIYLRGKLFLSGLQNVVVPLDAREVNLNYKKGLDVLSMKWSVNSDDSRDGRVEIEVLDMLQPHKNLKELHIKGYLGTRFPTWIGDPLFSNMAKLSLDDCGNCAFLPPLGQLPYLKKLYTKGMSVLKHVGCEFYG
ncbi:hypothetical protein ACSBR2_018778 [Camellia fascicularis]